MREYGFSVTRVLPYERIYDSVPIRKNTGEWKPITSHILCSMKPFLMTSLLSLFKFFSILSPDSHLSFVYVNTWFYLIVTLWNDSYTMMPFSKAIIWWEYQFIFTIIISKEKFSIRYHTYHSLSQDDTLTFFYFQHLQIATCFFVLFCFVISITTDNFFSYFFNCIMFFTMINKWWQLIKILVPVPSPYLTYQIHF